MSQSLSAIWSNIIVDGHIENSETQTIKSAIYADNKIDKDEAEFIFSMQNHIELGAISFEDRTSFDAMCTQAIVDYLTKDETSSNEIDDSEFQWLKSQAEGDGKISAWEKSVFTALLSGGYKVSDSTKGWLQSHSSSEASA